MADKPTLYQSAATLAQKGAQLGEEFADGSSTVSPTSTLGELLTRLSKIPPGGWDRSHVGFLNQALRATVAMASAQLRGFGSLCLSAPPLRLHPVMTVLRGIAEATGKSWWLTEPYIDLKDTGSLSQLRWDEAASKVLCKSQLMRLTTLGERRNRLRVFHGESSSECAAADAAIQQFKSRLSAQHNGDPGLVLTGGPSKWRVGGHSMPSGTEMVTTVTELAYGAGFVGTGRNPYPLYSGYAHGSLELFFAPAPSAGRPPMSVLNQANDEEAQTIVGLALRSFDVGVELAETMVGFDLDALRSWETAVDRLILGPIGGT